ncbi:hypothetical protein H8F21_13910 [Pseudomonas sp. P66]|uniref:ABC transporter permease n=1 Tax=Pseudomonas arcuscaelestis TaxID=2710591 RepID=A0ABS2C095_9PSED|nr:hypothetical protein [Pseudomonas arcuscaelestis]MBM5458661.1 hypothetical protein [Pseudomonas arcuscaelestis]
MKMYAVIQFARDLWNGARILIPLLGILLFTWAFVSLITSGAQFEDALALGVSTADLSPGAQLTRYGLLSFFFLFSTFFTGCKVREATALASNPAPL